ncbi:hypothetical protein B7755_011170 [Streptomyces sp. NBS 14/10]|uniref:hypothetical protein n=1 Tax=Streptomyces sp. NBS 14/10 TaxID=1945643 RepID=UPI00211AF3B8|nr:hypothetical protein [Streptomyces sp. NBS 14/10]KAK1178645.1 hypothetical protein B7755_011170 [Streptomyces sp. NBS 14/10]
MNKTKRPAGVVPWAVAAGTLAWGLAGNWRAEHMRNYPWNVWTPIGYGAAKGVVLGLLAGWCAVWFLRLGRSQPGGSRVRTASLAFTGGLLAGITPGTIRDFTGPPQPRTLYYFDEPRPDAEWYWQPLLSEWLTYTVLPALGCALALTAAALLTARPSRRDTVGWAVLAVVGVGLLLLPHYATAGLPQAEGNGQHVNESATAAMTVWGTGLAVLVGSVVLRRKMRRATSTV